MKYERLTNKGANLDKKQFSGVNYSGYVSYELDEEVLDLVIKGMNRLAELEDKIEQGTLKDIPVNVGDTFYIPWVWNGTNGIAIIQVRYIFINETGIFFDGDMETDDYSFLDEYGGQYHIEEIGKKLFFTREEAEKRLEELKGGKE
jgi:hypothetical protein